MTTDSAGWRICNSCKGEIGFEETYYVCSVSTCNRGATDLRFCSVECWDVHVPVMRHRDAGAVEKRSPTQAEWARENETSEPAPGASPVSAGSRPDDVPQGAFPEIRLNDSDLPRDVLVVVSKLKAYIRARSGMNTSDGAMSVLSDRLRRICDDAIRNAARAGRKTVMDRDVTPLD